MNNPDVFGDGKAGSGSFYVVSCSPHPIYFFPSAIIPKIFETNSSFHVK